jgi:hypothetical protein
MTNIKWTNFKAHKLAILAEKDAIVLFWTGLV